MPVLYWSQALAGVVLVPIFAYILLLSNNSKIMRTTNSRFENFWLGCAVTGMLISNLLFFWFLADSSQQSAIQQFSQKAIQEPKAKSQS